MERNTRWALLAVALVGGLSVVAMQVMGAHGSKASDENLREVSGRIDAVRMANWHAEASAGAAKTSGPISSHSHGRLPGFRLPGGGGCIDVGTDCWNYRPVNLEEVRQAIAALPPVGFDEVEDGAAG